MLKEERTITMVNTNETAASTWLDKNSHDGSEGQQLSSAAGAGRGSVKDELSVTAGSGPPVRVELERGVFGLHWQGASSLLMWVINQALSPGKRARWSSAGRNTTRGPGGPRARWAGPGCALVSTDDCPAHSPTLEQHLLVVRQGARDLPPPAGLHRLSAESRWTGALDRAAQNAVHRRVGDADVVLRDDSLHSVAKYYRRFVQVDDSHHAAALAPPSLSDHHVTVTVTVTRTPGRQVNASLSGREFK